MTKNNQTIYVAEDDKYKKLAHSIKILNTNFNDWGDYRLNNLIDNVIKKIEFTDKFNFETV